MRSELDQVLFEDIRDINKSDWFSNDEVLEAVEIGPKRNSVLEASSDDGFTDDELTKYGISAEDLFKRIQTENYDSTRVFCFKGAKQLIKHINSIKHSIRENSSDWNEYVILADSSTKKEQSSGDEKLYDRIATMEGIKELNTNNICFNTSEIPYTSILSYKGLECKHVVLIINSRVNINTFELYVGMTRAIIDLQLLILQ